MTAVDFQAAMLDRGVSFSRVGDQIRAVTHLDVSERDVREAVEIANNVIRGE